MKRWILIMPAITILILSMVPICEAEPSFGMYTEDGRTFAFDASGYAEWDFGDGRKASGASVEHTFGSGLWTVTCTVGGTTTSQTVDVTDEEPVREAKVGTEYRCRLPGTIDASAAGIGGSDASWLRWDEDSKAIVGTPSESGRFTVVIRTDEWTTSYTLTVTGDGSETPGESPELRITLEASGMIIVGTPSMDITGMISDWRIYDSEMRQVGMGVNDPILEISVKAAGVYHVSLNVITPDGRALEAFGIIQISEVPTDPATEPEPVDPEPKGPDLTLIVIIAVCAAALIVLRRLL